MTFLAGVRLDVLSRRQFAQQQVALFDWALLPSLQFAVLVVTYRWWGIMWLAALLGLFIGFVLWIVAISFYRRVFRDLLTSGWNGVSISTLIAGFFELRGRTLALRWS